MDDDDDFVAPKTPFDYITIDQLQDLWGAGFTVIRRSEFGIDPFEIAAKFCRMGMAQQWSPSEVDGWKKVPAERHPGIYAPYSYVGDVMVGGMTLLEAPESVVKAARKAQVDKAHENIEDWFKRQGEAGLVGAVRVNGQTREVGNE